MPKVYLNRQNCISKTIDWKLNATNLIYLYGQLLLLFQSKIQWHAFSVRSKMCDTFCISEIKAFKQSQTFKQFGCSNKTPINEQINFILLQYKVS